jgi:hypothetical protein
MIIRTLTKQEVEAEPFRIWNAFVNILAMEDYQNLSQEQRTAYLVFWYDCEVQNGGHLQYFVNRGTEYLTEAIEALGVLGATRQQQILREASEGWLSRDRPRILNLQEFSNAALEGEFNLFDSRFYACPTTLQEILETYLNRYQKFFVRLV